MPGDPVTEQPFGRIGIKLDFSDPQVRTDLWKRNQLVDRQLRPSLDSR
jgi:hypothetical protein